MQSKGSEAKDYDLVVGTLLIVFGILLLGLIPVLAFFGLGGGPRWIAEARANMAGAGIMAGLTLLTGVSLRTRFQALKVVSVAPGLLLAVACFAWFSPVVAGWCLIVGVVAAISAYLSPYSSLTRSR